MILVNKCKVKFRTIARYLSQIGFDPHKIYRNCRALPWFIKSYWRFKELHLAANGTFELGAMQLYLDDRVDNAGIGSGHYFHQDFLTARRIFQSVPGRHADIGSRIDGFVAHIAVFREIEVFDIRPLASSIPNVVFRRVDLANGIDPEFRGAYDSVSCLHALEHFGLGRYGDALDYWGFRKGFDAISALVRPGGTLYLSVPMGPQRIEFNAQRVFSLSYLLDMCGIGSRFQLARFSYVDDAGDLHENYSLDDPAEVERNCGCHYGLAHLEMIKQ